MINWVGTRTAPQSLASHCLCWEDVSTSALCGSDSYRRNSASAVTASGSTMGSEEVHVLLGTGVPSL